MRGRGNPICTIPLINAKVYVITQPALIQAVFRSTAVSFEPLMAEFAGRMLGLNDEAMIPLRDIPEDHKATSFNRVMTAEIHNSMLGQNLQEMNSQALRRIAFTINRMGATFEPDSLYLWLRTTLTMATGTALFGAHNPMIFDPSLVDSLW
jgi:hypothetical protein